MLLAQGKKAPVTSTGFSFLVAKTTRTITSKVVYSSSMDLVPVGDRQALRS